MIPHPSITRLLFFLFYAFGCSYALAQSNTQSPYSIYGLGLLRLPLLTQHQAMGGIAAGISTMGKSNLMCTINPASYAVTSVTTIDIGLAGGWTTLRQGGIRQTNSTFYFNYINFLVPIAKRSGLSFGLFPYSSLGYGYQFSPPSATPSGNAPLISRYGTGGLSKAYIGYGLGLGKNLSLGWNVSYIFGSLKHYQAIKPPLNSPTTDLKDTGTVFTQNIHGYNLDYGIQYTINILDKQSKIMVGYSGSIPATLKAQLQQQLVASLPADVGRKGFFPFDKNADAYSIDSSPKMHTRLNVPLVQHLGISWQQGQYILIGADATLGQWSKLAMNGMNRGLKDRLLLAVGGQLTPNSNAIDSYWHTMDYRLGMYYDKTYIYAQGHAIKEYALTFGLGLPVHYSAMGPTYYMIHLSAAIGQRGTLANHLVKENFYHLQLGFTLNEHWFRRRKFD